MHAGGRRAQRSGSLEVTGAVRILILRTIGKVPVCVGAVDFGGRGDERLESISVSARLLSPPKHELCKVTSEMVALAPSRWKTVFDVGPGALHRIGVRTSVRVDKVQLVVNGEVREASVICKLAIASPTISDYSCSRADPLGY